jgi:hypothetical protein
MLRLSSASHAIFYGPPATFLMARCLFFRVALLTRKWAYRNAFAVPQALASWAGLSILWAQEGVHRDSPTGKRAQSLSEPQRCLFAAGANVAQVRVRATSSGGNVWNGPAIFLSPAEDRVFV